MLLCGRLTRMCSRGRAWESVAALCFRATYGGGHVLGRDGTFLGWDLPDRWHPEPVHVAKPAAWPFFWTERAARQPCMPVDRGRVRTLAGRPKVRARRRRRRPRGPRCRSGRHAKGVHADRARAALLAAVELNAGRLLVTHLHRLRSPPSVGALHGEHVVAGPKRFVARRLGRGV